MKARLYDEYIRRLMEVNDETVTEAEHNRLSTEFYGWQQGVEDAKGFRFDTSKPPVVSFKPKLKSFGDARASKAGDYRSR